MNLYINSILINKFVIIYLSWTNWILSNEGIESYVS